MDYSDNFDSYSLGKQPKYTSDQGGAFEIATEGTGKVLEQVITQSTRPFDWIFRETPEPYTILGSLEWTNYQVQVDAKIDDIAGYVLLGGRENHNAKVAPYVNRSFDTEGTGSEAYGWLIEKGTDTSCIIAAVPSTSDKSMKLYDNNSSASVKAYRDFEAAAGSLTVEFDYMADVVGKWTRFFLKSGSVNALEIYDTDNNGLAYTNSSGTKTKIMDIANDSWYNIRIIADESNDTFDLYVDDELKVDNASLSNSVNNFQTAYFETGSSFTGTSYVNNFIVRQTTDIPADGYNLKLMDNGTWYLRKGPLNLASGNLQSFNKDIYHTLKLRFLNDNIKAYIDSSQVADITGSGIPSGQVVLGSGYNGARFDNLSITKIDINTPVSCIRYNDNDVMPVYKGSWLEMDGDYDTYDRSVTGSRTANDTFELMFNGTGITVAGTRYIDCGKADVYIDDNFESTIDTYGSSMLVREALFSKFNLSAGDHTLKLVVRGDKNASATDAYIKIDAVEILGGTGLLPIDTKIFFDEFNNATTGNQPSDWTVTADSSTTCTVAEVPSAMDKSMKLYDNNASGKASAKADFTSQYGKIVLQFRYKADIVGKWTRLFLKSGATNAIEIYDTDTNGLAYNDSAGTKHKIMDISNNTWYTIKIIANEKTDKFDLYVDDVLKDQNIAFKNTVSSFDSFYTETGSSFTGTSYVDNVSITKMYAEYIDESYNSETTGNQPAGWFITAASNTFCTIAGIPSASDKSIKLYDNNITGIVAANRKFTPYEDTLIVYRIIAFITL